jgi:aspartyl/asparaginyl beta-hydroxylase (cupin superfamily)
MLWFSLYDNSQYKSDDNAFVDLLSFQGMQNLQDNWHQVLYEFKRYSQKHEIDFHFNNMMVEKPKSWRVRSLRVWGTEIFDIQKEFPITMSLFSEIPDVLSIGFNILEPKARIKPHCGDTNAIYRCHLGLQIPSNESGCVMKVLNQEVNWSNGKLIAFEDAFLHEAWNETDETRIILIFDVLKPKYANNKLKICATILSSFYLQQVGNVFPKLYQVNRKIYKIILFPFVLFLRFAIPIRNWLKK